MDFRALTAEDADAAWQMGPDRVRRPAEPPAGWSLLGPGRRSGGLFEGGRLVAKAADLEIGHFFGGRSVPSAGLAGVAVAPESRGTGAGRVVLTQTLAAAHERGAAISTLFPTVQAPYRRLGWEKVGTLRWVSVPTASLADVRRPVGVALRAATPADVAALRTLHDVLAGPGGSDWSSPLYAADAATWLSDSDGVLVAVGPAGDLDGFLVFDRGPGYDASAVLRVPDLVARTPDALAALLLNLASWASVAPTVHLRLADDDPAFLLSSFAGLAVVSSQPWMLRLVDAPAAVAARGWPSGARGIVDLLLGDVECPWNAGPWRFTVDGGQGSLVPGGGGTVRLSARGAAAWFAGTAPSALVTAGLLAGGSPQDLALLTAAAAGRPASLVDYF